MLGGHTQSWVETDETTPGCYPRTAALAWGRVFVLGMNKKKLTVFLEVQLIPALHKLKSPGKNSMDKWEGYEHARTTKSTKGDRKERSGRRSQGRSGLAGHEGDVKKKQNKVCTYSKNSLWAKDTERAFRVPLSGQTAPFISRRVVSPELCWLVPGRATVLTNSELVPELTLAFNSLSHLNLIRMDDSTTSERRKDSPRPHFIMSS